MNDHSGEKPNQPHKNKRISLSPLSPDDALRAALQVDPKEVKRREQAKKKTSKGKSKKKRKK